jgi:hypothetical protein
MPAMHDAGKLWLTVLGLIEMAERFVRTSRLMLLICLTLIAPLATSGQTQSDQSTPRMPDFFAARFQVDVPEFPNGATKRIEILCDQPSSCLFQAGKDNAVRYELVVQNNLLTFANGTLAYARANPTRFLTTRTDWNERFLKPISSSTTEVNQCKALNRREYPGGNIFICSLKESLWEAPAVLLIGELKVAYPELFFGTTLFPAFKVSTPTPSKDLPDKLGHAEIPYQPIEVFRGRVPQILVSRVLK